jgi:hypothetical protein
VSRARRLTITTVTLAALVLLVMPMWSGGTAGAALAVDPTTTTTFPPNQPQVPIPRIIPLPDSGHAPRDAGDPGGWEQYALFGAIVVGVSVIGLLIWRDARRGRRRQAMRDSTRSDPADDTSENRPDSSARQ